MRQARIHHLVLVTLTLGAVAWIAGCGGGGEQRVADAGPDVARDSAAGDAPSEGSPGDVSVDRPADVGIEAPGKPIGSSCAIGGECASGFCADGVCCNTACAGTCVTCAGQGTVGTCVNAQLGTDPRDECAGRGGVDVWFDRHVRRHRRVRQVPGRHGLQGDGVHRVDADVGVPLQRRRRLRPDARPDVRAVQLRDRQPLPDDLHRRQRLPAPQQLHQRQLRQEADRRGVRRRPRVQLQLLRAGRLLRRHLPRHLSIVRGAGQHRHLHQRPRRRRIRWASAPTRARAPAAATACATARRPAAQYASGTQCVSPACTGVTATLPGRCNGAGTCMPAYAAGVQSVFLRDRRRVPHLVRHQRRLLGRQRLQRDDLRQEGHGRRLRRRDRVCVGLVPAGRLLRGRVHGDLHVVRAHRQPRRLYGDPRQHRIR